MILAGEIGATRTRLAAFETEGQNLKLAVENSYRSPEHGGLPEIISEFVRSQEIPVHRACFGAAGPVRAGRRKISEFPWSLVAGGLAKPRHHKYAGLRHHMEA